MNVTRAGSFCVALTFLAVLAAAQAQHMPHGEDMPPGSQHSRPQGPFAIQSFGAFNAMVREGDYRPKVRLNDVKASGATEAVGALSGLRGEITMLDGRFFVTYGGGSTTCPAPHAEEASLLATGKVKKWKEPIALPDDLAGKALETFIVSRADAVGLDAGKPFSVRLTGTLINVEMHVVRAPDPEFTGHGSGRPMAAQDIFKASAIQGEVVGFYASSVLDGVISHPGESFHFHWIDEDRTRTAHIDAFGLAKGARLFLPIP